MTVFLYTLGFIGALIVLALAAVGVVALILALFTNGQAHRAREEARRAERQIAEIGRRAQVAILREALRRVYGESASEWPSRDSGLRQGGTQP
jgi:uncharacterized membrane protein